MVTVAVTIQQLQGFSPDAEVIGAHQDDGNQPRDVVGFSQNDTGDQVTLELGPVIDSTPVVESV